MGFQDYILLNASPTENLSVEVEVRDLHGNSVAFRVLATVTAPLSNLPTKSLASLILLEFLPVSPVGWDEL